KQAAQPGLASTVQPEQTANQQVTPEIAMQAYAAAQTAEEEKHYTEETGAAPQRAQAAQPNQAAMPSAALAVANEPQAGDYYRVGPAYARYLGYSPLASQQGRGNGGRFAGAIPERNATQSFFAPEAGYTQIITWERITITMGSSSAPTQQKAFSNNQSLAA